MLRASLNDKRDVVTVGEDLQLAREYLHLQLLRYKMCIRDRGEPVRVVNELAGNLLLSVKDSRIALDRDMAMRIMV